MTKEEKVTTFKLSFLSDIVSFEKYVESIRGTILCQKKTL